jgi:hypothetical protein
MPILTQSVRRSKCFKPAGKEQCSWFERRNSVKVATY